MIETKRNQTAAAASFINLFMLRNNIIKWMVFSPWQNRSVICWHQVRVAWIRFQIFVLVLVVIVDVVVAVDCNLLILLLDKLKFHSGPFPSPTHILRTSNYFFLLRQMKIGIDNSFSCFWMLRCVTIFWWIYRNESNHFRHALWIKWIKEMRLPI